jgi:hypothetical protein
MLWLIEFIPEPVEGIHDKLAVIYLLQDMMPLAKDVYGSSERPCPRACTFFPRKDQKPVMEGPPG